MSDFIQENEARYNLWKFFSDEHGLSLTVGQMDDVLAAVEVYNTEASKVITTQNEWDSETSCAKCKHADSDYSFCTGMSINCGKFERE